MGGREANHMSPHTLKYRTMHHFIPAIQMEQQISNRKVSICKMGALVKQTCCFGLHCNLPDAGGFKYGLCNMLEDMVRGRENVTGIFGDWA